MAKNRHPILILVSANAEWQGVMDVFPQAGC